MNSDAARIARAIEILSHHWEAPPPLGALAAELALSPGHFQRIFRRMTGVSPKRFTQALRAERAERLLEDAAPLLGAAHGVGLSGPGRLHDLIVEARAMTPGELRRAGGGTAIAWAVHPSPLGPCFVATTPRGVCELAFADTPSEPLAALRARWPEATIERDPSAGRAVVDALAQAPRDRGPVTLHLRGTNFQLRVWTALLAIPPERVTSYGALARALGRPGAARAVGQAVGDNPVAWLVPCHRVLRSHGALGGYRWGLERKRALLALEHAAPA
ncbi:MAG: methylated-DNA--[protein]-cysteine S-methyltransferase [Sandaracinaceae bacterium]|nr:methylated-DNA--[protein]-cysteine S-methyltransferase [Sandaracinaceae bacterium]